MKIIFQLLAILILFWVSSCKKESSAHQDTSVLDKNKVKEAKNNVLEVRPKDSINNENAVSFLTLYGKENTENTVLIKTRLGDITIRLYEDTPLHRASFIFLAKMGYFDTTCFYRVVPDFIIQGGESERLDTQTYKGLIGTSRRTAMPLMELFDELHLTRRVGEVRVLRGG